MALEAPVKRHFAKPSVNHQPVSLSARANQLQDPGRLVAVRRPLEACGEMRCRAGSIPASLE